jgi:TusA-related sulfurtransferase
MSETKKLDLQGLSCPEPAFRTKQLLKKVDGGTIEILVDSGTARDNVERIVRSRGWNVNIEDLPDGGYRLSLTK